MDGCEYTDFVEQGIALYWKTLGQAKGLRFVSEQEFDYVISDDRNGPERIFHIRFDEAGLSDRLYKVLARIKAGKLPDSFMMTSATTPQNLPELLKEKGFDLDTSGLCMAMDLENAAVKGCGIPALQMIELADEALLPEWLQIVSRALFGCELLTLEQVRDIYRQRSTRFYMGLYDGIPVSVCMTIAERDTATLELVATLREYRKRGIATALIQKALSDLKHAEVKVVTLRAEIDGIGVYENIGFREVCRRTVASCNWELLFKNSCPCRMDSETLELARTIYRQSASLAAFVDEMERQRVIGQNIWYEQQSDCIFITKRFACECGRACPQGDCDLRNRCHCDYVKNEGEQIPLSYCRCAAEYYRPMFAPILGDDVRIEPVTTCLSGSEQCTFSIRRNGGEIAP